GRGQWQLIVLTVEPVVLHSHVLAFETTRFTEPFKKRGGLALGRTGRHTADKADYRHCRLLRARRERPRDRRAAECSQQFPPSEGGCHTPLPCEVRRRNDSTPRACCPNPARSGPTPGTGCNGAPPGPRVRLDFKRFNFGCAASLPLGPARRCLGARFL